MERDNSFGFLIGRTAHMMQHKLNNNFLKENIDLTHQQWVILMRLKNAGEVNQKNIADSISRDKTSITRILDNMEKKGLISRSTDKTDMRNNIIVLSGNADDLLNRAALVAEKTINESLEGIPPEHIQICQTVFKKIYNNLLVL